jgi:hypothetical protein
MRRVITMLVALGAAGCHVLTGFDDLTLREDPEHVWSARFGDELPQAIDEVTLSPNDLRVAGQLEGSIDFGDEALTSSEPTRFLAQFDGNGAHEWSIALDPGISHHGLVENTSLVSISHEAPVTLADLELEAAIIGTAFEVVGVSDDGASADLVFSGEATLLTNAHVAQKPGDASVLVFGATFEGQLSIGDTPACPAVDAEDQNIAVAVIEERECQWLKTFGDGQNQWVDAVATDNAGNIIVAGRFLGNLDFGGQHQLVGSGGTDYFIVKLSKEGEALWSHRFGESDRNQRPIRLAVRPSETVFIAGYFDGTIDFGTGPITASLGHDIFVAKLDPSGNPVWTRHFPVRNDEPAGMAMEGKVLSNLSLKVDRASNTILAGHFRANVDFGGTVRSSDGDLNMFLAKLNVDGLLKWSGGFGDAQDQCQFTDCVTALAVDSSDHILLGGGFAGGMNLGGNDLDAEGEEGESDAFLAKFAP